GVLYTRAHDAAERGAIDDEPRRRHGGDRDGQYDETVSRVDEVADEDLPAQLGRDGERQRGRAEHDAQALLDHHREPERQEQAQNRIGAVEAAKQQPLDRDADETDGERRPGGRARETDAIRQDDREIGADRVKATVREIDDAAEREDQRQAERDQKVISADQEAIENLLEYEDELHAATLGGSIRAGVPAFAGTTEKVMRVDPRAHPILQLPSFGGAMISRSSFGPGTAPSAS